MNSTMKWIAGATLLVFVGTTACGGSGPAPAPDEQDEATEDIQESAPAPPPVEPVAPEAPESGTDGESNRRLEVQFAGVCSAGWQDRPAPFGNGRIGVNTVFRSATRQSTTDSNILDLYFFNAASGRSNPPGVPRGAEYVWVVETHDIDDRYRYREDGVRVCWRVR